MSTVPGISVIDVPSKGKLFWNNRSPSLPAKLSPNQIISVQEGLESAFPGREVIFDPKNVQVNEFQVKLKAGKL